MVTGHASWGRLPACKSIRLTPLNTDRRPLTIDP